MPAGSPPADFLQDTHVWIWLINGETKIRNGPLGRLFREKAFSIRLLVSVMSVWEVGMLEAKGRLEFPLGCSEWVRKALRAPGVALVPITPEVAVASSRLAGEFHGDPVDRILVATAQSLPATLVTRDSRILTYAKRHPLYTASAF